MICIPVIEVDFKKLMVYYFTGCLIILALVWKAKMNTRELIVTELDLLSEDKLEEVYAVIKSFLHSESNTKRTSFMSKLRNITIDAPEDFSVNFELYTNGEN
jgi:hypothetical protein